MSHDKSHQEKPHVLREGSEPLRTSQELPGAPRSPKTTKTTSTTPPISSKVLHTSECF